jgi:hypothetical protein
LIITTVHKKPKMVSLNDAGTERLKMRKPVPKMPPAYLPKAGSPLTVNKTLYATAQKATRVLIEEFTLPIRSGRAWKAPAGSIVRISTPDGPQVGMNSHSFLPMATNYILL